MCFGQAAVVVAAMSGHSVALEFVALPFAIVAQGFAVFLAAMLLVK